MLPSASIGDRRTAHGSFGLYEPIHGSAPDIAGRDLANPSGTILPRRCCCAGRSAARRGGRRRGAVGGGDGGRLPDRDLVPTGGDGRRAPVGRGDGARSGDGSRSPAAAWRRGRPPSDAATAGQAPPDDDEAPVILYDTTLRDGTQGEDITLSLADKLRVARMLDEYGMPYIEGGWPGSNPKDVEFFAAARNDAWQTAKLAAFGSTRHRANAPEDDPNLRELVAAETPVVTIFGKSWLCTSPRCSGRRPPRTSR